MTKRLPISDWENIIRNTREEDEEVEISWLDSGDEWALHCDCELFEDGFDSEEEARERLEKVTKAVDSGLYTNQKRIARMWLVNAEGNDVAYHYTDKERAKQYGEPSLVYVIMDDDYFIGTWQFVDKIDGLLAVVDTEDEAWEVLENYRYCF